MNFHFFIPGDINTLAGRYIYTKNICDGLRNKNHKVFIHSAPNDFPFPSDKSIERCEFMLGALPDNEPVIIDNLIFSTIPHILKKYSKKILVPLMHLPLSKSPDLTVYQKEMITHMEQGAYVFARIFIVSNNFTRRILEQSGIEKSKIKTILPGVHQYQVRKDFPDKPSNLVCIANYNRNKGLIHLVKALNALKDKPWKLDCYGIKDLEPKYFSEVALLVKRRGLNEKVMLHGPVSRDDLSEILLKADLFILPSDFESYGMSLMEALMHGIPVVASTGGIITEVVPKTMGKFFKPGDVYGLQSIIDELLDNEELYKALCNQASTYSSQAISWEKSVDEFEKAILEILN